MQARPSRWMCEPYEVVVAQRLAAGLGVAAPIGAILARRGFADVEEARRFLAAKDRHDPRSLPGVPEACELVIAHLRRGSRIAVFGDYDVDGVCSTAMLVRALRALGADPLWELPSRFQDGYGLSAAAVQRFAAGGAGLLVTVDCGITAVAEIGVARAAGLDVIVTDHHRPGDELPDCTIVHPALPAGGAPPYGCPELCASAVVLKLSEALREAAGHDPRAAEEDLDLAALATVCDLVPLRGESRRIVREGLVALARTRKPGLRALMAVSALEPADLSEQALGFRLGPRLNAAGRMGRADAALELLLTEDGRRADEVARELDLLNRDRREAETRIQFAADAACAPQAAAAAMVVAGEGWHPGVVGIVASRLVERWRRPCVVVALDGESARGSGRSIAAYDLHAGLGACGEHLLRFGGHRMAAGIELATGSLDGFRAGLAKHAAASLAPSDLIPVERVDAVVPGGALGLELAEELERLRPFGPGNPQPTLLVPAARMEGVAGMGAEREHARFTLVTAGGARSRGVAFGSSPAALANPDGEPRDIALRLERNRWKGVVEPRVVLRALCLTRPGELRVLGEEGSFWKRLRRELERDPAQPSPPAAPPYRCEDRRGEGFSGVAGELLTSGETVLVAVADVARRRDSLERLVAGLDERGLAVASWTALAADPDLVSPFDHLVALDPPPGGADDPLLHGAARAHLAWGPAEAEFTLAVWRTELELRPALGEAYRALRGLSPDAGPAALEQALRGASRYPRAPECCARLLRALGELRLVEFSSAEPSCRVLDAIRTDLERSQVFRDCRARLTGIERSLAAEHRPLAARAA